MRPTTASGSCRPRPAESTACSTSCRRAANTTQVRTAILAVRPYGRVVLMGGVGMLGGAGLDLPYPWMMRNCITLHGQWMYPPHATILMIGLIRAGLVSLDQFAVTSFGLDDANAAVAHAARDSGPFRMTVIQPPKSR